MFLRIFLSMFFSWINLANAWYFPEHALIAEEGVVKTPILVKKILSRNYEKLFESENDQSLQLCPNFEAPFFDVTKKIQDKCIP